MPIEIKVELFPDSGHHYYFLPLVMPAGLEKNGDQFTAAWSKQLLPQDSPAISELRKEAAKEKGWQPAEGEGRRWLRYRLGSRSYPPKGEFTGGKLYGLWVAIETNTGERERGCVWNEIDNLDPKDERWLKQQQEDPARRLTPYIANRSGDLYERNTDSYTYDLVEACKLKDLGVNEQISLCIRWRDLQDPMIPVHLIVDFGNSRTVVMGLEEAPGFADLNNLQQVCRWILFDDELIDSELADHDREAAPEVMPESGFVLRAPAFQTDGFKLEAISSDSFEFETLKTQKELPITWSAKLRRWFFFETVRTVETSSTTVLTRMVRRVPQMFVELSPAVIGSTASQLLSSANLSEVSFLSSPKRYCWDTDPVAVLPGARIWRLLPALGEEGNRNYPPMRGNMLFFLGHHRHSRHYGDPRNELPPCESPHAEERPWH